MNENRGKILWIDDEIDHLKPHILFLQEKGYKITTSSNGKDGIPVPKGIYSNLKLAISIVPCPLIIMTGM